jgi:hypothetical protein
MPRDPMGTGAGYLPKGGKRQALANRQAAQRARASGEPSRWDKGSRYAYQDEPLEAVDEVVLAPVGPWSDADGAARQRRASALLGLLGGAVLLGVFLAAGLVSWGLGFYVLATGNDMPPGWLVVPGLAAICVGLFLWLGATGRLEPPSE